MLRTLRGRFGHWVLISALACLVIGFALQVTVAGWATIIVWASLAVGLGVAAVRYDNRPQK
jgi:hypothetical protein